MIPLLLTGGSGLVGSRLKQLFRDTYRIKNLDLDSQIDITDFDSVDQAVKQSEAEVLVHLAAYTNVSAAYEQLNNLEGPCYQVNVTGTENVAKAAAKYDKYLIHISTDFVFDGKKTEPYTEEDDPNPIEWYGQTKYMAEQKVWELTENWLILRIAYPYAANPSRPDFVHKIIDKLQAGSLPPQFTDHTITPTYIDDLAKVIETAINNRPQGIYHAVGSSWHTDFDLTNLIKKTYALPGEVKPGKLDDYLKQVPRPYQRTMKVSNAKLIADFGITPKTFPEGIQIIKQQES